MAWDSAIKGCNEEEEGKEEEEENIGPKESIKICVMKKNLKTQLELVLLLNGPMIITEKSDKEEKQLTKS